VTDPKDVEAVSLLVLHHLFFGSMNFAYRDPQNRPPDEVFEIAAKLFSSKSLLTMLFALTEGDICGVREGCVLLSPPLQDRMRQFYNWTLEKIPQNSI
jgi:UTP:GlnB (protein PII) uridylyltransferase